MILITGGTGFIGTALATALHRDGETVSVVARTPRHGPDRPWQSFRADVRDAAAMRRLIAGAELVYHLATTVSRRAYVEQHRETVTTIVTGTMNVVDACLAAGVPLVMFSTSEVYGQGVALPMAELDAVRLGPPQHPAWSYGMSKALAEQVVMDAILRGGLDARIVRPFNVVGAQQDPDRGCLFPSLARAAVRGGPLIVHGDGSQRRTFIAVEDFIRGLRRLTACPAARGEVVNLGSAEPYSVLDIAAWFQDLALAEDGRLVEIQRQPVTLHPGLVDIPLMVPNLSRARALIGWDPAHLTPLRLIARQCYEAARSREEAFTGPVYA